MLNCYTPTKIFQSNKINSSNFLKSDPPNVLESDSSNGLKGDPSNGLRADQRKPNELRRIYLESNVINQASGSAYVELSNTKVICAVYGPQAINSDRTFSKEGQLRCDVKLSPFASSIRPEQRGQSEEELELSLMLHQALVSSIRLEMLTKSTVEVYVSVLADDGGVLGAAISCASLALADASIELYDLISGCTVGYCNGKLNFDPTIKEENDANGLMTMSAMASTKEVTQIIQHGPMSGQMISESMELCMEGCLNMANLMRQSLINGN